MMIFLGRPRLRAALVVVAFASTGASEARSAAWLDSLSPAFDTSVAIADAGGLKRGQVLVRRYGQAPAVIAPGLPATTRVAALAVGGFALLFTSDASFNFAGASGTPRDVIRHESNGTPPVPAAALGLSADARAHRRAGEVSRVAVIPSVSTQPTPD